MPHMSAPVIEKLYAMVTNSDIFKGATLGPLVAFPIRLLFTIDQNGLFQTLAGSFVSASLSLIVIYPINFLYGVPVAIALNKLNLFKPQYLCLASLVPIILFFGASAELIILALSISLFSWWVAHGAGNSV